MGLKSNSKREQGAGGTPPEGGNVLKELFHNFMVTLRGLFKRQPKKLGLTDSELASRLYGKRQLGKLISTRREGFPMPKFQRCPDCGRDVKIFNKTATGARYVCRCGLINSVTHPIILRQLRTEGFNP